jgi:hypothetical protein
MPPPSIDPPLSSTAKKDDPTAANKKDTSGKILQKVDEVSKKIDTAIKAFKKQPKTSEEETNTDNKTMTDASTNTATANATTTDATTNTDVSGINGAHVMVMPRTEDRRYRSPIRSYRTSPYFNARRGHNQFRRQYRY